MQSIHSAFNDRSAALLTVQTLITEISTLNARIEKLKIASSKVFGGDKTKNTKMEELKEALETTEAPRIMAVREYERMILCFLSSGTCSKDTIYIYVPFSIIVLKFCEGRRK